MGRWDQGLSNDAADGADAAEGAEAADGADQDCAGAGAGAGRGAGAGAGAGAGVGRAGDAADAGDGADAGAGAGAGGGGGAWVVDGTVMVVLVGEASEATERADARELVDVSPARSETAPTGSDSSRVVSPVAPTIDAAPKPNRAPPAMATFQLAKRFRPVG